MQKILVSLKRVVDYNLRIRVRKDGSGVETDGLKMSINPFDEIALEEALRIRERGLAAEIVAVSIGPAEAEQQLRTGLAMGADRALRIDAEAGLSPLTVARALLAVVERERPGLVLMGKQAIDGDNNQTGQMLAALWGRPQACFASRLEIDGKRARVAREVDAGIELVEIDLPAVVTTDLRLNEPRYVKLPEILKAKKKPLDVLTLGELGVAAATQFEVVATEPPPARAAGIRVADVPQLIAALDARGLL
jgi:electron transfer flavoprotein beta subunit